MVLWNKGEDISPPCDCCNSVTGSLHDEVSLFVVELGF